MKTEHQQLVEELMSKIPGQDVPSCPTIPDEKTRILRAKLILEEALETINALGINITIDILDVPMTLDFNDFDFAATREPDLVGIVDGCCDIKVVTTGTLSACGVHDKEVQDIVDRANLRKFGPGGRLREDGKWIKPPDFVGPDAALREFLGVH